MKRNQNFTMIDELFDADSLGPEYISKGNIERDEYSNQIKNRHIRVHEKDHFALNGTPDFDMQMPMQMPMQMQPFQPQMQMPMQPQMQMQVQMPMQPQQMYPRYHDEISCLTIANHIKDCPICSKFYNCDNSIYIVCIVVLVILCIILFKKIIEK